MSEDPDDYDFDGTGYPDPKTRERRKPEYTFKPGDHVVTAFRFAGRITTAGAKATSVSIPAGTAFRVREILLIDGATLPVYDVVDSNGDSFSIPEHKLERRKFRE